ncbi:MAG: quinolinate synthase NadA [Gemmatimonadota bacterium]|nr:MAG: quinolinate synthase NadA [Gemmatimonadota bacterium]
MERDAYEKLPPGELIERIARAKAEKNAVLLVHNYQKMEIQELGDFIGDSLGLSQEAAKTDADVIEFCGVDFMAESAKILNPNKTVLIPEREAHCPMAAMITPEALRSMKTAHPNAVVVCYVNTTAAVKAESDICCTSSNAIQVVQSLGDREIIFVPDKNLAAYVAGKTGANIIPWDGHCYVHADFTLEDVQEAKKKHPEAKLVVHPECPPEVINEADWVTSTSGMVTYVEQHRSDIEKSGVVIGTEIGLVQQLKNRYPGLEISPLSDWAICTQMKMNTLAKVAWSLENNEHRVELPAEIMNTARLSLERMLEVT